MAKALTDYGLATLISVQPVPGKIAWAPPNWREWFIGHNGRLRLYASERKRPGWRFLIFRGCDDGWDEWELKTWYGSTSLTGNILTFTTQNTIYQFELEAVNNE